MKEKIVNQAVDLAKFVWSYSRCPDRDDQGFLIDKMEVVPFYSPNTGTGFNEVSLQRSWFCSEPMSRYPIAEDSFGIWYLIPRDDVYEWRYTSCTGSLVHIKNLISHEVVTACGKLGPGPVMEVLPTGEILVPPVAKNVGNTTLKRLRAAGYKGPACLWPPIPEP